mmetsp:Transcript_856/g.1035  ORF Transcript_856/g.1035 Transcript_856/m.1035 type:complete len:427 (+) Transcript_856:42-1322(+)
MVLLNVTRACLYLSISLFLVWMPTLTESFICVGSKLQQVAIPSKIPGGHCVDSLLSPLVTKGVLNLFGVGINYFPKSPPRIRFVSRIREAVKEVGPSVVRIDGPYKIDDSEFESQGSGVLWGSEGLILTNAHVVEGLAKIFVTIADGRRFEAEIKGFDDLIDIAVLKIVPYRGEKFPEAKFGDSDQINVGQVVVALGSPCGLDKTATMGIVSGLRRSATDVGLPHQKELKVNYIQTDATINDGNSGGPLVDVESGNVIGINVCVRSNMERTGFTIPINKVQELAKDLSSGETIHRFYIGALVDDVTSRLALQMDLGPDIRGAIVSAVHTNSPADVSGLMKNDIIIQIGLNQIRCSEDVSYCIDRATRGEPLHVTILREGDELCITIFPVDSTDRKKTVGVQDEEDVNRVFNEEIVALSTAINPKRI